MSALIPRFAPGRVRAGGRLAGGAWATSQEAARDSSSPLQPLRGRVPRCGQVRNAHNYTRDFLDEMQLYEQAGPLVSFLSTWSCTHHLMADCCLQLTADMARYAFWPETHVALMHAWLHDLRTIGYEWKQGGTVLHAVPPAASGDKFAAVTLFLRATTAFLPEARDQLARSLHLFWPCDRSRIAIVLDDEKEADHVNASDWLSAFSFFAHVDILYERPDPTGKAYGSGHDRQQWTMFHARAHTAIRCAPLLPTPPLSLHHLGARPQRWCVTLAVKRRSRLRPTLGRRTSM